MGFTDTILMNEYLLIKWIVKLKRGNNDMCISLLTHGQFSTAFSGVLDVRMEEMWQSKLPLKGKIFYG
jgi:hypothetical protein